MTKCKYLAYNAYLWLRLFNFDIERFNIDEESGNIGELSAVLCSDGDPRSVNRFFPQREQQVQDLHGSICLLLVVI